MADENQFLHVIRVWAGLAWADGKVVDEEQRAMKRLIDGAALTETERTEALAYLESPVELDTVSLGNLNEQARHGIYRAAARLATVDRNVADEERAFLERLRQGLDIAESDAREIESGILPE